MEQKKISARVKGIIEVDGLKFKDLDGTGELKPYEDWRLTPAERAEDLVKRMTDEEKAGLFYINSQMMGISVQDKAKTSHDGVISEYDGPGMRNAPQFPTTMQIKERHQRHILLRENAHPHEIAAWINTMEEICEETRLGIPCIVACNSKNESSDICYDAAEESNKYTTFPGTLGIAASHDEKVLSDFISIGKKEFMAANIRKGYMYMADCATDPRWFRTYGTFGENPDQISDIIPKVVLGYQGEKLNEDSIALTIKHFPGGGARENGFDPHYAEGQFNVYATPGSLEKYHLPAFKAAAKVHPSSIMPYYAIPSNKKSATPQAPFTADFDEEIAFAYNKQFITGLLRGQIGFDGYVNSDTGVMGHCAWGAQDLSMPERAAKILNAGTDVVSGESDPAPFIEAIKTGLVSEETVNTAAVRLLKELFALGLFEDPYVDVDTADSKVNTPESIAAAYEAHQKSVVLLKNKDNILPLTADKLEGKKVYVEMLMRTDYSEQELQAMAVSGAAANPKETVLQFVKTVKEKHPELNIVDDYKDADIALLFLKPASGSYFEATPSYLELNIMKETGVDVDHIKEIRAAVGTVVMNVNLDLPFLMTNVEPLADALTVGFDTFSSATIDVMLGAAAPVATLPITLPGSDAAIAVDENGICASPNDVPGYDKAKYMKDGLTYAYKDSEGNEYIYGFGLKY